MGNEYKLSFSAKEIDEKLNQISIPNYEQNNAQGKGYIKNRPFYVDDNGGVHKLDTKFLKTARDLADAAEDEIALAKDVYELMKNSIPEASIPDWEQNNPQGEGYIKNRPFYEGQATIILDEESVVSHSIAVEDDGYTEIPIVVGILETDAVFNIGKEYTVIYTTLNGDSIARKYTCTTLAEIAPGSESALKNNPLIYDAELKLAIYGNYGINKIVYQYRDYTYASVTVMFSETEIKTLDTKFLNTTSEITENSTSEEIPTAKSVYDIVKTESSSTTLKNIVIGNASFDIKNNEIVIPIATKENFGVVKSSSATNDIAVREDGTMEINEINVNKIVQDSGDTLLLASGTSKL